MAADTDQNEKACSHIRVIASALRSSKADGEADPDTAASIALGAAWALRLARSAEAIVTLEEAGLADAATPIRRLCIELSGRIAWLSLAEDHSLVGQAINYEHDRSRDLLAKEIRKHPDGYSNEFIEEAEAIDIDLPELEKGSALAKAVGQLGNMQQLLERAGLSDHYTYYRSDSASSHATYHLASGHLRRGDSGEVYVTRETTDVTPSIQATFLFLLKGIAALDELHPVDDQLRGAVEEACTDLGYEISWS